jgi:predicted RND superfamily exporter protein
MDNQQAPFEPLPSDVIAAIQRGNKIETIKRLCAARNLDLKNAKDLVDSYVRNDPALTRKYQQQSNNSLCVLWLVVAGAILVLLYFVF